MQKYEYKQFTVETKGVISSILAETFIERLNELGSNGWEFVQAIPMAQSYGRTGSVMFILKRPEESSR